MNDYDTTSPVMVTGATGYVAGWVVKRLLDTGFTVHAAVRDPSNAEKLKYLDALAEQSPGTIHYFKSDLMEPGSYAEAMKDCSVVFHTASPFVIRVSDPQKDLVDPAQLGTRNVLEEANRTPTVRRVVVTSSCAAIYGDNADLGKTKQGKFTEDDWNTSSSLDHQPYSYSKALAEREAWKIAEAQGRWDLVTVNPSLVLGPAISPHATSESFTLVKQFADGTMKSGVPNYGMGVVDVREVAEAHFQAAFNPAAKGRYITSGHNSSFPKIAKALSDHFGDRFPFPKRILPKWLVWLVAPLADKHMTRRIIRRNVGVPWIADNSKSIRDLGLNYRPLAESAVAMLQQMIDNGVVAAK